MRRSILAVFALALGASIASGRQFIAEPTDFECVLNWPKPDGHKFRIFNRDPKRFQKAMKIALRDRPHKHYPVGTIIQLIPQEAMVKRGRGFNKEGNGWEFFALRDTPSGTEIVQRSGLEVTNVFTHASCQGCHGAARKFDLVCETDHGCVKLPDFVNATLIGALQAADRRCHPRP